MGITGDTYTIAETSKFLETELLNDMHGSGFSIKLNLTFPEFIPDRFMVIASITDNNAETQFLLGQWENLLVLMNGNDYENKQGFPNIYLDISDQSTTRLTSYSTSMLIKFSKTSTTIYINNGLRIESAFLPKLDGMETAKLTFTNTADRQHGWPGSIQSFSIDIGPTEEPLLSYDFVSSPVSNKTSNTDASILFPPNYRISAPDILTASTGYLKKGWQTSTDVIINTVGFMPFGLLVMYRKCIRTSMQIGFLPLIIQVTVIGAILSVSIELLQAYIPSRHSNIYDFALNTFGTLVGSIIGLKLYLLELKNKPRVRSVTKSWR